MNVEKKVVVITGGTSGIGLHTARLLTEKGYCVYELSRKENGTDAAIHIQADVTDEEQVRRAIQQIAAREKHIDIVINNAGFGISGAIEYTDTEEAKRQFDVNFFGHQHEFGRRPDRDPVSGVLLRLQSGGEDLQHGAVQ